MRRWYMVPSSLPQADCSAQAVMHKHCDATRRSPHCASAGVQPCAVPRNAGHGSGTRKVSLQNDDDVGVPTGAQDGGDFAKAMFRQLGCDASRMGGVGGVGCVGRPASARASLAGAWRHRQPMPMCVAAPQNSALSIAKAMFRQLGCGASRMGGVGGVGRVGRPASARASQAGAWRHRNRCQCVLALPNTVH